jgi:hypothetical protein
MIGELARIGVAVLAVAACLAAGVAIRRRLLLRSGAVDVSLRRRPRRFGGGWALGVGRYTSAGLVWHRVFAFTLRPDAVLSRDDLEVAGQRVPRGAESWAVQSGALVVDCTHAGRPVQLAMDRDAVTGFLAWIESAPSGSGWDAGVGDGPVGRAGWRAGARVRRRGRGRGAGGVG